MNNFDFDNASYADLHTEAKRLNELVSGLQDKVRVLETSFGNRNRQYLDGYEILKELIENREIDNEEAVEHLIRIFEIKIMRTVHFTLSVEVTGTVEIPFGEELDEYSFEVDGMTYNSENVDIDHTSVSIEGWDFEE